MLTILLVSGFGGLGGQKIFLYAINTYSITQIFAKKELLSLYMA